jgi:hypothetical protein
LLQNAVKAEDHVIVSLFDAMKISPLRVVYIGPSTTESPNYCKGWILLATASESRSGCLRLNIFKRMRCAFSFLLVCQSPSSDIKCLLFRWSATMEDVRKSKLGSRVNTRSFVSACLCRLDSAWMVDKHFIPPANIKTLYPFRSCSEDMYRPKDATVCRPRASLLPSQQ